MGLACGAIALQQWVQKPRITQMAALVARQIRLAKAGLEWLPEDRHAAAATWFNSRGDGPMLISLDGGQPAREVPLRYRLLARQFVYDLKRRLPFQSADVGWSPLERGTVWVRVPIGKTEYWFTEKGVTLDPDIPATGIALLVLIAGLSVSGAALIQRRINRPLSRLVEAAGHVAAGRSVEPLEEGGAEELATVSRAFNRMALRLAEMDAERAVMLAGVSHDLRTPISKMRLAIEMLGDRADVSLTMSMLRSAAEMEAITEQFLYYARPDPDGGKEAVDLNDIVAEAADRRRGSNRQIIVNTQAGPNLTLHRESIMRAVDNLLENAPRYSDGEIEIETTYQNGRARIAVKDRGPGIPVSEIEALKRPFARGDSGFESSGAGLGLAIVERIARAHAAQFDLTPRDDGGLEARIDLPADVQQSQEANGRVPAPARIE